MSVSQNIQDKEIEKEVKKEEEEVEEEEEELEFLDDAIIYAWENKQQEFVEAIENFLIEFIEDKERQEEMIGNVNKFQRKVIHQLCERCNVARTYVDIKNNSDNANITIQKTLTSAVPTMRVGTLYDKHLARTQIKQHQAILKQQQIQQQHDHSTLNPHQPNSHSHYYYQQQLYLQQMQQANPYIQQVMAYMQQQQQPTHTLHSNYNLGINKIDPNQTTFKKKREVNNRVNNSQSFKPRTKESPLDAIQDNKEEFPTLC